MPAIFNGTHFSGETVNIDDAKYVNCVFRKCSLRYSGLVPFRMEGCAFIECGFQLIGAASNTIEFLNILFSSDIGGKLLIASMIKNITNGEVNYQPKEQVDEDIGEKVG